MLSSVLGDMHGRRGGYPHSSLIDFAVDGAGHPLLCLSPLSLHAGNLAADPRCCVSVGAPGWQGLGVRASVALYGDVFELAAGSAEARGAAGIFALRSRDAAEAAARGGAGSRGGAAAQRAAGSQEASEGVPGAGKSGADGDGARGGERAEGQFDRADMWVSGGYRFYRMHEVRDVLFTGGFGTVRWVPPRDFAAGRPDAVVASRLPQTLAALNAEFGAALAAGMGAGRVRTAAGPGGGGEGEAGAAGPAGDEPRTATERRPTVDDCQVVSVDAGGCEVRVRRGAEVTVERLAFRGIATDLEGLRRELAIAAGE